MNNASLELGGDNWAAKDTKLLASTVSDDSGRFYPREFTFTRGSNLSATRVNADGYIEKGYENLLVQSNQFDTTWVNGGTTVTSGQSGYDGTNNAWLLSKGAANYTRITQTIAKSGVHSVSVYAKANTLSQASFYVYATGDNPYAIFNLVDGSVVASGSIIDKSATDVGNGWWRLSITFNATTQSINFYPDFSESNAGSIYIQDAMLNQGLAALPYIESGASAAKAGILENEPRIDYSDGTPSLLLEPQRTQLCLNSEYYSGSDWISSNVTITDNVTASPEGLQNASLINFTSSGNYFQHQGPAIVSGSTYTISCYVKRAISTDQVFKIYGNNNKASANLTATSEWQRFTHTFTADSTNFASGLSAPSTAQIHLYGFQVEQGSYPTSYIPNHSGGSVTRGADTCSKTNASSLIGQSEGTLFIECEYPRTGSGGSARKLMSVNDGTSANLVDMYVNAGANTLTARVRANGGQFGAIGISNNPTGIVKIAYAYKANDYVLYINGTQYGSVTSGGSFTFSSALDIIQIGDGEAGNDELGGEASQALLFKTRLSNADLATLTTI